jgi:hypothetical protein
VEVSQREPVWQDVLGILVGIGAILVALTRGLNLPYPAGDVRATPEFNGAVTGLLIACGLFFVVAFTIRLVGGLRHRP